MLPLLVPKVALEDPLFKTVYPPKGSTLDGKVLYVGNQIASYS